MNKELNVIGSCHTESFKEDLDSNMRYLDENCGALENYADRQFCRQLCDFYEVRGYVTNAQIRHLILYLRELEE